MAAEGRGIDETLCSMSDHHADGTYRWWHLSGPSPELLQALSDGWLPSPGLALDVGCGLGSEAAHLHALGWRVVGLDVSAVALDMARVRNPGPASLLANLLRTPMKSATLDACLDRGCLHYLAAEDRAGYAAELRRVLRPGGKLLLRASRRAAGVRNDIDESVVLNTFSGWRVEQMQRAKIPSDTRTLDVLLVRLVR
jgi:SAM-dependent methyltransferase